MFDMVRNWSLDRVKNKIYRFHDSIKVTENSWIMAYNFLHGESKGHLKQVDSTDKFKLTRGNVEWFNVNQFDIKNLKAVFHYANNVSEVTLNRHEWSKSTCTCCYFLKNYSCYHVLVMALKLEFTEIPFKFRNVPILQKKKPGRKKIAKSGLSLTRF